MFWKVRAMPSLAIWWRRHLRDVTVLEEQFACGRIVEPRDQVEDRGLARAVGSDDGEYLTPGHAELTLSTALRPPNCSEIPWTSKKLIGLRSDFT